MINTREFHAAKHVESVLAMTPEGAGRTTLSDAVHKAQNANIPWFQIAMIVAQVVAGGFSPTAIAAAVQALLALIKPATPTPTPAV